MVKFIPERVAGFTGICIPATIDKVFSFFINNNLSRYYQLISKAHIHYILRNGTQLEKGSVIDCEEKVANQHIRHVYVVSDIVNNERIMFKSCPSIVTVTVPFRKIETKSNTYVYYDFCAQKDDSCTCRLTIEIQFANALECLFMKMTGGLIPWRKHCSEEMSGLQTVLLKEIC